MVDKLIDELKNNINSYKEIYDEYFVLKFTEKVFKESNFDNVNKIINYINEPKSTWKNNIIYKLSDAFNWCKYEGIPLQRLVFIESYKLMASDAEKYNIDTNLQLFVNDIYFSLLQGKFNDDNIRALKYYLIMLNIIWLIDFRGSNIYFLVQKNFHDEYYNQLLFHVIQKFNDKISSIDYYWYSPRIIYAPLVYTDIVYYKYKNYNTLIDSVWLYKLLHKIFINNKWAEEDILRQKVLEWIKAESHISDKYCSEENMENIISLLKNPYTSEVDVLQIKSYWDDDNSSWWVTEESISSSSSADENVKWSVEDVIKLMWWENYDPFFFILYDVFFNKINTVILYQLKEFEDNFNISTKYISLLLDEHNINLIKYKMLLNNINHIEQHKIINQKKEKYWELFKTIQESF